MREEARTDEQQTRRGRQVLPQITQQLGESGDDHRPDHEDRRDTHHSKEERIGERLAHPRDKFCFLFEVGRHLPEGEWELTAAFAGPEHAEHDPRHDAAGTAERLRQTFPFVQSSAGGGERITQGPSCECLARGHRPLERHASRDECRDALEHDREVAPAGRAVCSFGGLCGRDRQGEQATVGDHGARLRRGGGIDQPFHDSAVGTGGTVAERGHRCPLSHDVMSASSFVPPGCPSRPYVSRS